MGVSLWAGLFASIILISAAIPDALTLTFALVDACSIHVAKDSFRATVAPASAAFRAEASAPGKRSFALVNSKLFTSQSNAGIVLWAQNLQLLRRCSALFQ